MASDIPRDPLGGQAGRRRLELAYKSTSWKTGYPAINNMTIVVHTFDRTSSQHSIRRVFSLI